MSQTVIPFKIKRRTTGAPGAPSSLLAGQIAYNEVDGYFYVGYGDDGGGNATSIKAFAKDDFNINKLVPAGGSSGQVLTKSSNSDYALTWGPAGATYTGSSGITVTGTNITVDSSVVALLSSPSLTGSPTAPTQTANDNTTKLATTAYADRAATNATTGLLSASTAASTYAPLVSPVFTGTPQAPTPSAGTSNNQLATTAFVLAAVAAQAQGMSPKGSVRAIASSNVAALTGTMTIDGVALVAGDRVLLVGQTTASQNGIYVVASGAWSRSADMTTWAQASSTSGNAYVLAELGTQWGGHGFIVTNDPQIAGTIDTTGMTWSEFTGATDIVAGNGISKSGNTIVVNYASGLTLSGGALVVDFSMVAPLASPAFTGNPTAPLQATGDNSTKLATTSFIQQELANLVIDGGTF